MNPIDPGSTYESTSAFQEFVRNAYNAAVDARTVQERNPAPQPTEVFHHFGSESTWTMDLIQYFGAPRTIFALGSFRLTMAMQILRASGCYDEIRKVGWLRMDPALQNIEAIMQTYKQSSCLSSTPSAGVSGTDGRLVIDLTRDHAWTKLIERPIYRPHQERTEERVHDPVRERVRERIWERLEEHTKEEVEERIEERLTERFENRILESNNVDSHVSLDFIHSTAVPPPSSTSYGKTRAVSTYSPPDPSPDIAQKVLGALSSSTSSSHSEEKDPSAAPCSPTPSRTTEACTRCWTGCPYPSHTDQWCKRCSTTCPFFLRYAEACPHCFPDGLPRRIHKRLQDTKRQVARLSAET